jgi:DNA-binding transcriptional MerR regulator
LLQSTVSCQTIVANAVVAFALDFERARSLRVVVVSAIAVQEPTYTIAEVAERTGVTAHTLRYYERIGLLDVGRHASGHRRFSTRDLHRIVFIGRLRATAMPIRDIQGYFALVARGPSTERERLALLEAHRAAVRARLGELEAALDAIEHKIARYGGSCAP